ncbi:hypothetical protein [Couchioplanes caeruleus]|uniref:Uncharacterized protein n=1 Tax=Couchioplanes caeruleus subsp. caeruleus TaxID=56427 RepID=A0A1K0FSP9_9ACTN|nr:hypothetical protein [Couchioplanes caeruleus]OJF15829.1 hypothetical protein BG844_02275 [Couchioplanes caeruleus subsp. caeruleus]
MVPASSPGDPGGEGAGGSRAAPVGEGRGGDGYRVVCGAHQLVQPSLDAALDMYLALFFVLEAGPAAVTERCPGN